MALANMTQEETNRHNEETCKHIADELLDYARGNVWKCEECGEEFNAADYEDFDDENPVCPMCESEDVELAGMWNWLEDVLSIESYTINPDGEYMGAKVCVAWGGPGIYVDTNDEMVKLFWWGDKASYPIHPDAVEALDAELAELYCNTHERMW